MGGVSPEKCWAIKKHWNNKFYYAVASCWFFLWDLRIYACTYACICVCMLVCTDACNVPCTIHWFGFHEKCAWIVEWTLKISSFISTHSRLIRFSSSCHFQIPWSYEPHLPGDKHDNITSRSGMLIQCSRTVCFSLTKTWCSLLGHVSTFKQFTIDCGYFINTKLTNNKFQAQLTRHHSLFQRVLFLYIYSYVIPMLF